jgi:peptidyl-Asp metalloendopeptidase
MNYKRWRIRTCVLGAALLSAVATERTGQLVAQEGGGLFTAGAADAQAQAQSSRRAMGEMRSRTVNIDASRLPSAVDADRPDRVSLNLFNDAAFVAEIDRIEQSGQKMKTYIGHLEGLADQTDADDNRVTLVVNDGVMVGNITTSTGFYQVRFNGKSHVIRQVDPKDLPAEGEAMTPAKGAYNPDQGGQQIQVNAGPVTAPPTGDGTGADMAADDGSRQDLMVVYTGAARAAEGGTAGIQALIALGVSETNQAYARSNIGTRLRLVHQREVAYAEGGSYGTLLSHLSTNGDGQVDLVHGLRNTYGADMVQMMVDNGGGACGVAWLGGPAAAIAGQQDRGFSIVDNDCVSPNYSFAHELGHNQGAHHAPEDGAAGGGYAFSRGYKHCGSAPFFRTIMAYACTSGNLSTGRILNFSNPLVNYLGVPTGTANHNNALTIHNTRVAVANWRQEVKLVRVTSVWPPADAADLRVGLTTTLWAYVVNDGPYVLPATARVYFYTNGPGAGTGEGWVGSVSVGGLAPSSGAWYAFNWPIPLNANPGAWTYQATVWDTLALEYLSGWSPVQNFTILSVQGAVTQVWPVPVTQAGTTATLYGRVQNTGTGVFPAGTYASYWVSGPGGLSGIIGDTSVAGLAPGANNWYSFNWNIPATRTPGAHTYWVIVRRLVGGTWHYISTWSAGQNFTVTAAPAYGAQVLSLWNVAKPAGGAPERGFPVRLWANMKNTGLNVHDANTYVYFHVVGPGGFNQYVGSASTVGLASGGTGWEFYDWTIPAASPLGAYSYRAIGWRWTGAAWVQLTPFSAPQPFNVASDPLPAAAEAAPDKSK